MMAFTACMAEKNNTLRKQQQRTTLQIILQVLSSLVAVCAAIMVSFVLFFVLDGKPFGFEIAACFTYTWVAYWQTFCETNWESRAYSFRDKPVRQQLPRLIAIHCGFLFVLLVLIKFAFAMQSELPAYWLKEGAKGGSLFSNVVIILCVSLFMTEALVCRRILSRAADVSGS